MNKDSFIDFICCNVKERLGETYTVKKQSVRKNNNVMRQGIMISDRDKNIAPTIYLDQFYDTYKKNQDMEGIVEDILAAFWRGNPSKSIDMDFFTDFSIVKEKLCYRLINAKKNEELLNEIPYLPFLDLAICLFYPFEHREIGEGSILVRNSHLEHWGVKIKDLWETAEKNTKLLYPAECCPMEDMLLELVGHGAQRETERHWKELPDFENYPPEVPMTVLTNSKRIFGSSVILYKGYLERIADRLGQSFFILPSSIHEWIIYMRQEEEENAENIRRIIWLFTLFQ